MPGGSSTRSRKSAQKVTPVPAKGSVAASGAEWLNPIITMDDGGVIRSASDSVEKLFGWTPMELFGRNVKMLIPEPRRSALDRYLDRYRNADTSKSLTRTRRFDAVRKDGSLFQIELSMSRAELPIHSAPFFIGIVRDVSNEIDIGPDSERERARMHQLIMEQTRALATAHLRLQLADRMAALGTLAAGLGHDLNNVLLPVRARLDAMEHAHSITAARTHMKAMRLQVAYLQSLSDGLHALTLDPDGPSSAEGGIGSTQLTEWWRQVGPLLRKAAPRRVSVTASFPAGLPPVGIAPQWLTQAMLNLIVNAGEAIADGRKGLIHVWADARGDAKVVRISVRDNGGGMSREVQRRALDLFFTTKARSMGTGLGLPLARKVALRAGGELSFTSQVGEGTTVVLELPSAAPLAELSAGRGAKRRAAAISVENGRTAALIGQVLLGAGLHIRSMVGGSPGQASIWVTDPTLTALKVAELWHARRATRVIALVGEATARTRHRWAALGAINLGAADDIRTIRYALSRAFALSQGEHHATIEAGQPESF